MSLLLFTLIVFVALGFFFRTLYGRFQLLRAARPVHRFDRIGERMRDTRTSTELARVGMKTEADVRTWYVCDQKQLIPAIAGAIINTDDNMHVETTAPRETFLPLRQTNDAWIDRLVQTP